MTLRWIEKCRLLGELLERWHAEHAQELEFAATEVDPNIRIIRWDTLAASLLDEITRPERETASTPVLSP